MTGLRKVNIKRSCTIILSARNGFYCIVHFAITTKHGLSVSRKREMIYIVKHFAGSFNQYCTQTGIKQNILQHLKELHSKLNDLFVYLSSYNESLGTQENRNYLKRIGCHKENDVFYCKGCLIILLKI